MFYCIKNSFHSKFHPLIQLNRLFLKLNKKPLSSSVISDERESFDVNKYREMYGIKCLGHSIADPLLSFDSICCPQLIKRIKDLGYLNPTPVQSQTLPIILENRDLVSIASSGSGKTFSFVLPAIIKTLKSSLNQWPKCLILTPTRELTHQIERVVKQFRSVRSVCLYGGVSYEVQQMLIKKGNPHIVIGTPSRLQTIFEKKLMNFSNVDYVVVDEADRILTNESAFATIMQCLPSNRQTLMFSATWSQSSQLIADPFLRDFIRVTVSQTDSNDLLTINKNIQQLVRVCKESEKIDQLFEVINDLVPTVSGFIKTIIFVRHKTTANKLVRLFKKENYPSRALHSDKSQNEREFVIREFKRGTIPILIATDVASRGLDFENVRLVINFDFPSKIEDYIHRIGRTARHEKKGTAVTLFTSKNICHKSSLLDILYKSQQKVEQKLLDLSSDENQLNCEPTLEYISDSNHYNKTLDSNKR